MAWLSQVLQSRGKFGAIALICLGGYGVFEAVLGKAVGPEALRESVAMVLAGLSLLGIRARLSS